METQAGGMHVLRGKAARERAAADPAQVDIEAVTGASPEQQERETEVAGIEAERFRSLVERAEAIQERVREEQESLKELFQEAKSAGFPSAPFKEFLRERAARAKNNDAVDEKTHWLDLFRRVFGG